MGTITPTTKPPLYRDVTVLMPVGLYNRFKAVHERLRHHDLESQSDMLVRLIRAAVKQAERELARAERQLIVTP